MSIQKPIFCFFRLAMYGLALFSFALAQGPAIAQTPIHHAALESVLKSLNTIEMDSFAKDEISLTCGRELRLKFGYKIPEVMVENPEVVRATPISPNEIQVTALKPGHCVLKVSNLLKETETVLVRLEADVSGLRKDLGNRLPHSRIEITPLQTGVVLSGDMIPPDDIKLAFEIAQDHFPARVINQMQAEPEISFIRYRAIRVSKTKLWRDSKKSLNSLSQLLPSKTGNPIAKHCFASIANPDFTSKIEDLLKRDIAQTAFDEQREPIKPAAFISPFPDDLCLKVEKTKSIQLNIYDVDILLGGNMNSTNSKISPKFKIDYLNALYDATKDSKRKTTVQFAVGDISVGQTGAVVIDLPNPDGSRGDSEIVLLLSLVRDKSRDTKSK